MAMDSLLGNSLLRGGRDPEVEDQLRSALSYLNRSFDDVPERLTAYLGGETIDQTWRTVLTSWVAALSQARDERLQATRDRAVHPLNIDPTNYRRTE